MTPSHIRVVYDGVAVQDGEMDVAQFASSLLALGKLIENADLLHTGEPGRVKVRVQSDLKRGSFDVGIAVHWLESFKDAAFAWVQTPEGASTLAVLGILGFTVKDAVILGGKGVLQTVRWLRGRHVVGSVTLVDGNTELTTDDGDKLVVHPAVAKLIEEPTIRQPLEKFTEPLREEGVEEIRFEEDRGQVVERIISQEADNFTARAGSKPTSFDTFRATYQIKRLFFERGRKWRLSSGAQTITAEIEDEAFWILVEASQMSFSKDDYLECRVRMDQWFSSTGLKTEYTVEKVEKHIPSLKQPGFLGI